MKNKKTEANLSMIVSKTFSGLNANALKYLLPLWIAPLTGVMYRCVFAAIVFWIISILWKQEKTTRLRRGVRPDRVYCSAVPAGSDRIIWFHVLLFAWSQQNNTGLQFAVQQPATDLGIHPFRHFPTGTYYGNEDNRYRDRLGRRTALHPDAEKRRFGFRCFYG